MNKFALMIMLVVTLAPLVAAQDENKGVEVFGGYSYLTIDDHKSGNPIDHVGNLEGLNISLTGFITKRFGITGDFSAGFRKGTETVAGGTLRFKSRNFSYFAGPHFRFTNTTRVTPFIHALAGISNNRFSYTFTAGTGTSTQLSQSASDFALALGGGLDVRVHKRVAIRVFQIDYNPVFAKDRPQFGSTSVRFDNVRFSMGIVFR